KSECYDLVKDGRIDIQDLVVFAQNFGTDNSATDFNGDSRVDISDLVEFARHFGQKKAEKSTETLALAAAPAPEAAPVVEPEVVTVTEPEAAPAAEPEVVPVAEPEAAPAAEPAAAPAFIPAQDVKLETVEAKEETNAAMLASLPAVENTAVQVRDSIFSSNEDEDEDWLEDICSDMKQDTQNQLIDDLFGKN
ncbi:MAG: hypothetical protein IJQ31_07470, partial [Thermoguttaceae bacterium]|nr:hypothetical protein [Thermoguttaceae bacterium]